MDNETSAGVAWIAGLKVPQRGVVNLPPLRNPEKAKQRAAQSIAQSCLHHHWVKCTAVRSELRMLVVIGLRTNGCCEG